MGFSEKDKSDTIKRYKQNYNLYGYSPKSLGWDKGKQDIRFQILIDFFNCRNKSILDIGCGFGDINRVLTSLYPGEYEYLGIDLIEDFILEAETRYQHPNIKFELGDFLESKFNRKFDIVLASGIFNHKMRNTDQYGFINDVIKKAYSLSMEGLAFDFLSDKVDFRHEHTFHSCPSEILSIAYKYSRNIILRNDYFPFEFALNISKDDSFSIEDTIFHSWKKNRTEQKVVKF